MVVKIYTMKNFVFDPLDGTFHGLVRAVGVADVFLVDSCQSGHSLLANFEFLIKGSLLDKVQQVFTFRHDVKVTSGYQNQECSPMLFKFGQIKLLSTIQYNRYLSRVMTSGNETKIYPAFCM